jgi:hypothetical protein
VSEVNQLDDPDFLEQIQRRAMVAGVDDLYATIGEELPSTEREEIVQAAGLRLPSREDIGRLYINRIRPLMEEAICLRAKYCQRRNNYDSAAKIASLVATAAAEVVTGGASAMIAGTAAGLIVNVSAVVLKEGLDSLCDCQE